MPLQHGVAQQLRPRLIELAKGIDLARPQLLIAAPLPLQLQPVRMRHPRRDLFARFSRRRRRHIMRRKRGHIDLHIDAIEQRPGNFISIFRHHLGAAMTLARRMPQVTARAGIHRRDRAESAPENRPGAPPAKSSPCPTPSAGAAPPARGGRTPAIHRETARRNGPAKSPPAAASARHPPAPPPEVVWWGLRYGRTFQLAIEKPRVSDCTAAASSASSSVIGGNSRQSATPAWFCRCPAAPPSAHCASRPPRSPAPAWPAPAP